jgi:hypothetical protein
VIAESNGKKIKSSGFVEVTGKTSLKKKVKHSADKTTSHSQLLYRKNSYSSDTMTTSMDSSLRRSSRRSSSASQTLFPCKPKFVQVPSITQLIHLKQGEQLVANANVLATPDAAISWHLNNFELKPGEGIQILQPAANSSTLIYQEPVPGVYKIVAANAIGSASYEMRLIVDGYVGASSFMNAQQVQVCDKLYF